MMSFKGLLVGMGIGSIIAISFEYVDRNRHRPTTLVSTTRSASPVAAPAQPIEDRLRNYDAQDAWLKRRDLEFDRCATLHGTPTLGFGMRVVCLESRAVKFLGEEHPPYE